MKTENVEKLAANLLDKTGYFIKITSLKQALNSRLIKKS